MEISGFYLGALAIGFFSGILYTAVRRLFNQI